MDSLIRKLGASLEAQGRCFQRGAYVLDVTDVKDWALRELSKGTVRPFQKTHDSFPSKITPQVELPFVYTSCGEMKRVLLTYAFTNGDKTYVYIKPETYPAKSLGHVSSAIQRYVFKKTGGEHTIPSRREDEPYVKQLAELNRRMFSTNTTYNTTVRVGNEMYVPGHMVKHFLGL